MPELPEVETVVRDLNKKIVGKKIKKVEIFNPKIVKNRKKVFVDFLEGQKIKKVSRRGKLIMIFFQKDEKTLIIHFRMTGQLIFQEKNKIIAGGHNQKGMLENLPNKYSHTVVTFSDNSQLFYNDVRQFGYLQLVSWEELNKILLKFGYEPLEKSFNLKEFETLIFKYKYKNIKAFLLDQSLVAGIGNIYADEILFATKVKPHRKTGDLEKKEIKKMFQNIKKILQKAVDFRGTTFNNYRDADGVKGSFKKMLKVYQRQNEKCLRQNCSGVIQKIKIAGRGTHFCSICQR